MGPLYLFIASHIFWKWWYKYLHLRLPFSFLSSSSWYLKNKNKQITYICIYIYITWYCRVVSDPLRQTWQTVSILPDLWMSPLPVARSRPRYFIDPSCLWSTSTSSSITYTEHHRLFQTGSDNNVTKVAHLLASHFA